MKSNKNPWFALLLPLIKSLLMSLTKYVKILAYIMNYVRNRQLAHITNYVRNRQLAHITNYVRN